ncbi:hypothetical protein HYU19_01235 [Candidatus Woesearchaeota archaeon]|nr:hypothetical protein [Candidatus Woesearchaeota archaeon]
MKDDNVELVREKFLEKHDKEDLKHHYDDAADHRQRFLDFFRRKKKAAEEKQQEQEEAEQGIQEKEAALAAYPAPEDIPLESMARSSAKQIPVPKQERRRIDKAAIKEMARRFEHPEEAMERKKAAGSGKKPLRKGSGAGMAQRTTASRHYVHPERIPLRKHLQKAGQRLERRITQEASARQALPAPHQGHHEARPSSSGRPEEKQPSPKLSLSKLSPVDVTSDVYLQKLRRQRMAEQKAAAAQRAAPSGVRQAVQQAPPQKKERVPFIKIEHVSQQEKKEEALKEKKPKEEPPNGVQRASVSAMNINHPIRTGMKIGLGIFFLFAILFTALFAVWYFFVQ